jgi:hypothetical protein
MMTFKAAQKLVKDCALGKYHYRAVQLLSKLVLNTYSKTQPDRDIETVTITKRMVTIKGWLGGISDRQLRTLFAQVEEIKVVKREPGKITVLLNLQPLRSAESGAVIAKRNTMERKVDRAAKARTARAKQRTIRKVSDGVNALREMRPAFMKSVLRPHSADLSDATKRKFAQTPYRVPATAAPAHVASAPCAPTKTPSTVAARIPRRGPIVVKQVNQ